VNDRLFVKRAETIKAYLEIKGIDPDRVRTIGRGLFFPIATNATKDGRQQNRRTDI
jgi:OOP family OmpA-OmpF porin